MESAAVVRHQSFEQRNVHTVEVLHGIDDRELRPQVQLQGGVPNRREIHQNYAPVSLLQRDGRVDRSSGRANSALGVQECKDPGLAGTALCAAQRGGESGEGFDHRLAGGATVQKLARSRPHRGDDVGRLGQFSSRKNCDVPGGGVNHFNGADGPLRILWINIHQHDFRPLIEYLPEHCVAGGHGKPDVAEHGPGHMSAFDPRIQNRGLFAVLREDGDGYPVHESILALHGHATNFLYRGQMTFVIEGETSGELAGWQGASYRTKTPTDCWSKAIVGQVPTFGKPQLAPEGKFQRGIVPGLSTVASATETRASSGVGSDSREGRYS